MPIPSKSTDTALPILAVILFVIMLTGFAVNTASQYLRNNCEITLEKAITLLTLSAFGCFY